MSKMEELNAVARAVGYDTRKRHIFLCTRGVCSDKEASEKLWIFLKKRIKELQPNLSVSTVARTKADCLRVCKEGPIALVYPEGTLYSNLTEERLERIIKEHLIEGNPVEEWIFHKNKI